MANLTIVVDDELLRRARIRAAELETSVNAILREYLHGWAADREARAQAVAALLNRSRAARSARRGRAWRRDDLHDR